MALRGESLPVPASAGEWKGAGDGKGFGSGSHFTTCMGITAMERPA